MGVWWDTPSWVLVPKTCIAKAPNMADKAATTVNPMGEEVMEDATGSETTSTEGVPVVGALTAYVWV